MHPELLSLSKALDDKVSVQKRHAGRLVDLIANEIESVAEKLPYPEAAHDTVADLRMDHCDLRSMKCTSIVSLVEDAISGMEATPVSRGDLESVRRTLKEHWELLKSVFQVDEETQGRGTQTIAIEDLRPRQARKIGPGLALLATRWTRRIQNGKDFDKSYAEKLVFEERMAQAAMKAAVQRVSEELEQGARVQMCTIGSSHLLIDEEDEEMNRENVGRPTIVVYDEAGCIPSYELLGLKRLGRSIISLLAVGDKQQLPPYDPSSSQRSNQQGPRRGGPQRRGGSQQKNSKVSSILDASGLTEDNNKIALTKQYRVPRDIAGVLDARVYRGAYKTAGESRVPDSGFRLQHVQHTDQRDRQYVNSDEIRACFDALRDWSDRGHTSMLILTPVRCLGRSLLYYLPITDPPSVQKAAADDSTHDDEGPLQDVRESSRVDHRPMPGPRGRLRRDQPRTTTNPLSEQESLQCSALACPQGAHPADG